MAYLDGQARRSQARDKALQRAIGQTQARIEQASALLRSKKNYQAGLPKAEPSPESRTPEQSASEDGQVAAPAAAVRAKEGRPASQGGAETPFGGSQGAQGASKGGAASPAPALPGRPRFSTWRSGR
ncbi:MAG: hypothetical protein AAB339_12595, partial [Elusimicrobiota bacterium]